MNNSPKQPRRVIAVVKLNDLEDYIKRNGLRDVRITVTEQGLIMEEQNDDRDTAVLSD